MITVNWVDDEFIENITVKLNLVAEYTNQLTAQPLAGHQSQPVAASRNRRLVARIRYYQFVHFVLRRLRPPRS